MVIQQTAIVNHVTFLQVVVMMVMIDRIHFRKCFN